MSWIFYGSSLGLRLLGIVIGRFYWVHLLANAKEVPHANQRKVARMAASYLVGLGLLCLLVGYSLTQLTHM
ncbi:hypothetical protein [Hymenobacter crusticola]|uniref:Uncharacterized protein n=1 Tax=Hymenobacter crusticola TaxID=1770526 RepID=A0A243W8Q2_9BACT|nr:hypothetical protein [Hymenobacter crusticola]OUJ69891.1 hypothetical protein BXP70_25850 [Hymenobacter crusticola]